MKRIILLISVYSIIFIGTTTKINAECVYDGVKNGRCKQSPEGEYYCIKNRLFGVRCTGDQDNEKEKVRPSF